MLIRIIPAITFALVMMFSSISFGQNNRGGREGRSGSNSYSWDSVKDRINKYFSMDRGRRRGGKYNERGNRGGRGSRGGGFGWGGFRRGRAHGVPELNPGEAAGAIAIIVSGVWVIVSRRKRRQER